ncbi:AAA family ATPase [Butyricimonas hominis]|uniref:ATP-binding protein n=1 Tax=Butyricimonas TaxID=574697 RepID=UPI003517D1EA
MNTLYRTFKLLLDNTTTSFVRYLHDQISWDSRLIAILGARGVGKTTLLLQHIKLHDNIDETLFVTADDLYFSTHTFVDLALQFYQNGGKKLYIDEIHKYPGWSREIKNIYDLLPGLKVVYTGSSILDLEQGGADLSRRKLEYRMTGLSFREFLVIARNIELPVLSLEEILSNKIPFPHEKERPLPLFKEYLQHGFYPFFNEDGYHARLRSVLNQTLENDIPIFAQMNVATAQKLKKMLYIIAQSVPFKPNFSKLSRDLDINRNAVPDLMFYLEKAGIINQLRTDTKGIKLLGKVDKVYLNNTNLAYAITDNTPDIGNIRETVFFSLMRTTREVVTSSAADFTIGKYTFEVGGKNKNQKQIEGIENAYIVKDDIEYGYKNIIPLWAFGLTY